MRDVRLRIFNVLGKWIEHYWFDFETDPQCTTTATQFLDRIVPTSGAVAKNVKTKLDRKVQATNRKIVIVEQNCPKPVIDKDPRLITLLACEAIEVARQITLMTWETWAAIKPWECIGLAWTKKGGKAEHVELMTKNFNYFSGWVTTTLITTPSKDMRVKFCKKFLDIAFHLRALGNFNGVMEIWSGLNRQPVWRMTKTFAEVFKDHKYNTLFQELKELTSHDKAYATLRAAIQSTNPPVIPYLGMYLSDLVFIEEGNPKKFQPDDLINYYRCKLISTAIKKIQQYQHGSYALEKVESIQVKLLRQVLVCEEADMYAISSYHEPRDGKDPGLKPPALDRFEEIRKKKLEELNANRNSVSQISQSQGKRDSSISQGRPKSRTNPKLPRGSAAGSRGSIKPQRRSRDQLSKDELELADNLCSACWAGQFGMVQTMLESPLIAHVANVPNARGQTALYCAARQGKLEVIIELLNSGLCDINIQVGDHKGTALHAASFGGHPEAVAILLWAGSDESLKNAQGLLARQEAKGSVLDVFALKDQDTSFDALRAAFPKLNKIKIQD